MSSSVARDLGQWNTATLPHRVTLSEAKGLARFARLNCIGCEVLRFAQNDKLERWQRVSVKNVTDLRVELAGYGTMLYQFQNER
jgi:hypothetical protein